MGHGLCPRAPPRMRGIIPLVCAAAVLQAASGADAGGLPVRGLGGWLARLGAPLQAQPPLRGAGDQALWDAAWSDEEVRRRG